MNDRYFAKVVGLIDSTTVVINAGELKGIGLGDKFLLVGLGDIVVDPDTNEELDRLEIVRGKVKVVHVQSKISTVQSCEYVKADDVKQIKKVTSRATGLVTFLGPQDSVTESITPGKETLKVLAGAQVGDLAIRA
ncbi:hypothetical protein [Ralstonia sp. 1B3]|uniref:hypothetical protein n=1 Tax=Ralstonia sp. 1B3 TaxID=2997421 RepID=UPI002FC6E302